MCVCAGIVEGEFLLSEVEKYVASCSFGKDSLATIILALEYGEPLDEAIYCEVMFDNDISGEVPEHKEFIYEKAIPFLVKSGINTTVLKSEKTFISCFYKVIKKGPKAGFIKSWPLCGKCIIQRDCKLPPINRYKKAQTGPVIQYIGIAKDEQDRLIRLDGSQKISLLDKYGVDEAGAFEICRKAGLLSPIYEFTDRGGCFFCPNAKMKELRHLYDFHPDLWARLLECQKAENKCTELFNRDYRFDEIDSMFQFDDMQISFSEYMQAGQPQDSAQSRRGGENANCAS